MKKVGFGIAETLIASMILSLLAVAFYALNLTVQQNILLTTERAQAAAIAQQELEGLQYDVEHAWKDSDLNHKSWDTYLEDKINNINKENITDKFSRQFDSYLSDPAVYNRLPKLKQGTTDITSNNLSNVVRPVKVIISWQDGSRVRQYILYGLLTNWQPGLL